MLQLKMLVKYELKSEELASKQELKWLELKIAETTTQIIVWLSGIIVASGLLQHFF